MKWLFNFLHWLGSLFGLASSSFELSAEKVIQPKVSFGKKRDFVEAKQKFRKYNASYKKRKIIQRSGRRENKRS